MKRFNLLFQTSFLFLAPLVWNSCMTDECTGPATNPKNIGAVAGNGQVALSWQLDSTSYPVYSEVRYATAGGTGENCGEKDLPQNCTAGCPSAQSYSCTISGLTNGRAYAFTVVTATIPTTLDCGNGIARARSALVTPSIPAGKRAAK